VGSDASEQGLLGLAFPQDYAETGLFYVSYTDLDGNSVISRFQVPDQGASATLESEQVILTQDQPEWNHNGGMIAFGPDNYLYIGFGDGGGQGDPSGNGQDLGTFLGKILRIEVDPNSTNGEPYVVPEDNPFVDDADAQPEIWAYGLRNPWRFSFDTETGDLWIADVGQSEQEEVNVIGAGEAGVNFGWSDMEGPDCFNLPDCNPDDYTSPVFTYTHSSGDGCSITGGYVSHGEEFAAIDGVYVFGDYCSGLVWGTGQDDSGEWVTSDPVETGLQITSFGQGSDGTVYLVSYGDGTIYELVPPL
jgi:glucose/arabinose dehydrogenase